MFFALPSIDFVLRLGDARLCERVGGLVGACTETGLAGPQWLGQCSLVQFHA